MRGSRDRFRPRFAGKQDPTASGYEWHSGSISNAGANSKSAFRANAFPPELTRVLRSMIFFGRPPDAYQLQLFSHASKLSPPPKPAYRASILRLAAIPASPHYGRDDYETSPKRRRGRLGQAI